MTPEDAKAFGVKDGEAVKVLIKQADREVIFGDTIIRVSPKFKLAMHIDTDESNAANAGGLVFGSKSSIAIATRMIAAAKVAAAAASNSAYGKDTRLPSGKRLLAGNADQL
jgi:hypothetical protein